MKDRGVSPILSNLLMTVFVVVLGTAVVVWGTTAFGLYEGGTGFFFTSRGEALKERFVVEYVWFPGGNNVTIYVRNAVYTNRIHV